MGRIYKVLLIVMFTATVLCGGTFYWYYHSTQGRIVSLEKDKAKLALANDTNQKTIDQINADQARSDKLVKALNETLKTSAHPVQDLRKLLSSHNLELLAEKKPGLIEKRINDGTAKALDDLRTLTSN